MDNVDEPKDYLFEFGEILCGLKEEQVNLGHQFAQPCLPENLGSLRYFVII